MNKNFGWAIFFTFGLFCSCGNGADKNAANKDTTTTVSAQDEPIAEMQQSVKTNFKLDGHEYAVSINRNPDKSLPLVVDEFDQKFYDNSVEIIINRDGLNFFNKKFTKEAFADFLPENFVQANLLLGMNCDTARCENKRLCFTAQVGQAGEGPAFLVLIPTDGGPVSILRDEQQEELNYD